MIVHDPENELKFLAMEPSKTWQEIRGTWPCCFKVKATVYQLFTSGYFYCERKVSADKNIKTSLSTRIVWHKRVSGIGNGSATSQTGLREASATNSLSVMMPGSEDREKVKKTNGLIIRVLLIEDHAVLSIFNTLLLPPVNDGGNTELDLYPIVNNTTWLQVILPCARLIPSCLIYTSYLASCRLRSLSA